LVLKLYLPIAVTLLAAFACNASALPGEADAMAKRDAGAPGLVEPTFECPRFADSVLEHRFGTGPDYGQGADVFPANVLGPPQGTGCCTGGLDVATLGDGGTITLGFGATRITDGPGADFVVFENAFLIGGSEDDVFAELAVVEVSEDGERWTAFPCDPEPPYDGCAGTAPVYGNYERGVDPLDPGAGGGNPYDLADVGVAAARYVRITDVVTDDESLDCCFDLDAVGVLNAECLTADAGP